ncbi:MAG: hypothetical protein GOMPHAMPRED_004672 [Gomphillus americanus]|uniref:Methyltransferase n=1 Tax=Gomphillus americanus TaxID=1940652 RepID=A0A8H3FNQ1_9LECA|nr:MAG: hypothetical protein GOMPHAMPRED_004672 [Gomphillus americanus]
MERLDIAHNLFMEAFGTLHNAPLVEPVTEETETRILDIGSGTGIWAIDMADQYPAAEVIGLDLVNKQPQAIPPNVRFRVPRDYEGMWSLGHDSFDLIYLRLACGGVSSWHEMYSKIFQHLKPELGYLEQIEIDIEPRCDDGPVPKQLSDWYGYLIDASERAGKPLRYNRHTTNILKNLGFVDVKETVLKLPINDWATQEPARGLGRWNSVVFHEGVEALSLGPLTRVYNWPVEDVQRLCKDIKAHGLNRRIHCYQTVHLVTARRPA